MPTLILDAGNTRMTCAVWDGEIHSPHCAPGRTNRLLPPVPLQELGAVELPSGPEGVKPFQESFRRIRDLVPGGPVVLVSVVPRIAGLLPGDLDLIVVDHTLDLPFDLGVDIPAQVGPDRLCNMATAAASGLVSALVVDAGTATTFDLLLEGKFVGGLIAPGMAFAARKLGEAAARLEPVPFGPAGWEVGRNTEAAMAGGAWHVGTGGVLATVSGLLGRYGDLPVIVTGGLGSYLQDSDWYQDPHWTLRGAAILAQR